MVYVSILFRKVGKRKAVARPEKISKRQAKKERKAKKDPNKPKRPPSAFFVFLSVSSCLSAIGSQNCITASIDV